MQIGDRVNVEVSRDKLRPGTVVDIIGKNSVEVQFDLCDSTEYYSIDKVEVLDSAPKTDDLAVTAVKYDGDKPRLELIPASGINAAGRAMTYGSKKYADHNWANGFEWDRLVGSLLRHINAWREGEDVDPESGLNHTDHICANAMMLAAHVSEGLGNDNRRKRKTNN